MGETVESVNDLCDYYCSINLDYQGVKTLEQLNEKIAQAGDWNAFIVNSEKILDKCRFMENAESTKSRIRLKIADALALLGQTEKALEMYIHYCFASVKTYAPRNTKNCTQNNSGILNTN